MLSRLKFTFSNKPHCERDSVLNQHVVNYQWDGTCTGVDHSLIASISHMVICLGDI